MIQSQSCADHFNNDDAKMYVITFFNKYHQTTTPMAACTDLEKVKKAVDTLNASVGYEYAGGQSIWDQKATGMFSWTEIPMLEDTSIEDLLKKKLKADNPYGN